MIKFFTEHPTASNLLMGALILLGFVSIPNVRRELLPEFTKDLVQVRVIYPGASPEDVEDAICRRVTEALKQITNIEEIVSTAEEGVGTITAEMKEGGDFDDFKDDIRTEIDAIDDFPEIAEEAIVTPLNRKDNVIVLAVTGPRKASELKNYCEYLKEKILNNTNIAQVDIDGFSDRQLKIKVSSLKLQSLGLSASMLVEKIKARSLDIPGGTLKTDSGDFLMRFFDRRKSVKELKSLTILTGESGEEIQLGDIAEITDDFQDEEDKVYFNGRRAGILKILKNKQDDIIEVADSINNFIERERELSPPGIKFAFSRDRASHVKSRLDLITWNGIQGLTLVFLTLWLFFSFRFSFWVALGLPVSILGAITIFPLIDYSINMITMVALLVGIGLLMDDAIVISENIAAHLARGEKSLQAAVEGTKEVAIGVLSSFATTVCVFLPLSFITGNIGKIMKVLPVVLILVLTVSLIEAFFILPHHLHKAMKKNPIKNRNKFRQKLYNFIESIRNNTVGGIVNFAVEKRYIFISMVICIFLISLSMISFGILKFRLFPEVDGRAVIANILLPQGTPLQRTKKVAEKIVKGLNRVNTKLSEKLESGEKTVQNISIQYNYNIDESESGAHAATIVADLLEAEKRNLKSIEILNLWREEVGPITGLSKLSYKELQPGPGGIPIAIRIQGKKLAKLRITAMEIIKYLNSVSGIKDISDDSRPGKPEIRVSLKKGAEISGISSREIANQIRASFFGGEADNFQKNSEDYEIAVYLKEKENNLDNLDYFYVPLKNGKNAPLNAIANIEFRRGMAKITDLNGIHTVTVTADVDRKKVNVSEVNNHLWNTVIPKIKEKHPELRFSKTGESKESGKTGKSLLTAFLVGLCGIFVLLSFQFKSYIEPLFIMAAIPFAFMGVIWGHLIMGISLSMPSMIGFVSLCGIVVNDSILLVEFYRIYKKGGDKSTEAAKRASRARFRAVLLTSITTMAGLVPIMLEKSLQAQILIPLAVSIVFGLLASTMLVLFVIPALYSIKNDFENFRVAE